MKTLIAFIALLLFASGADSIMEWSMAGFIIIGAVVLLTLAACTLAVK